MRLRGEELEFDIEYQFIQIKTKEGLRQNYEAGELL